jgi:formiminoglutamate deiminase
MRWFAPYALLPSGLAHNVLITADSGRFVQITPNSEPAGAEHLPGVTLPGFANAHSHAFHRAVRGRTHHSSGDFWTWRQRMYAVAARLDPDSYLRLARATYAEMAIAGITCVGEFHYLHHGPGGVPYDDPNAMAAALQQAAIDAGIRLTLLDACYLAGGLDGTGHLPLDDVQRRFADHSSAAWEARVAHLRDSPTVRIGVAIHSIRAVPLAQLSDVRQVADHGASPSGAPAPLPLHVHLSEQPAENEACQDYYHCTPTELLRGQGVLAENTTAVHATHLTDSDIATLGRTGTTSCFCPTTERDLADGIGPARRLQDAGSSLSLGSDQHAVIDSFEEARGLEMHERLTTLQRGVFSPSQLLDAMTRHDSLGWSDAGRLEVGARADLVAVRLDSVRTAGADPAQIIMVAAAADVDTVIVDGRTVVAGGVHCLGDIATLLTDAIAPLWSNA